MESSSASEGASPDVRPVICESLLDLSDWGDLLVEQSSKGSSAEEQSDSCTRSSPPGEIPGNGTKNLPHKTQQTDPGVTPSVLQTNGTALRTRKRIRHSWPEVSVKLGQDVTYNCFPHEHFSYAFKEVIFREEKIQEEDDDDDLPEINLVPSPEPTFPPKREKSSHKRPSKTVKVLHNRKPEKKASVLTEQRDKNTPASPHSHGDDKKDKLKEGRSSPLITFAVSSLKKPGVIKERKLVPTVVTSGGPTVRAPVTILQPGVHTSSSKGAPSQQNSGTSNVLQIVNTSQDGRSTPTHPSLVTVLPPTPPNEPVLVQPMPQAVSQVMLKGLPKQLPAQRVQVVLKQVAARPPKPQGVGVSPLSSPIIQVMKQSQMLTPPIDKRVSPVSSPGKPEQSPRKSEQYARKPEEAPQKLEAPPRKLDEPPVKTDKPLSDIPSEKPQETPSEAPAKKDTSSMVTSPVDSSEATGKPTLTMAADETVTMGGADEEMDVFETMKPSQDEADSHVEVPESKVEMREDTKEVLSSLKRKAPSSPCSNLLKIKCEKIDAVVRINKTNEDLYRAEGSQEKRSVQARRNSRSAAEQGCFFNVVDKSSRLGVCPCGRANSYDAMIACDNPQCEVEWYHFTCVGVTKVPKDEWFCPFCSKEAAEALKRKKERRKELRRKKKEEMKRKRMKKEQEEEGLCPCGQPNSWDRMIACDGRDCSVEWYHFRCVDVKSAPDSEWLCILCRDNVQEPSSSPYVRRKRRHRPIKYSIYGESCDGSTDDTKEEMEWKEDESGNDSSDSTDTTDDDDEDDARVNSDDGRSRVREQARSKWREALSEEVDVDGDSDRSSSDDDELSRSKRSRRMRHKKIDLDFEDGAEFDDDDLGGRWDEIVRTKTIPKRSRTSSGEKRSSIPSAKTNEPLNKEKDMHKIVPSGSSDQATEAVKKQKIVSEGRFLIQECSSCGQDFITPPTKDSSPVSQDSPISVLCHLCVTKSKKGDEKTTQAGILLHPPKTKDTTATATPSPATGGQDAAQDALTNPLVGSGDAGAGRKDGDPQGSRSTRFHEIVACKVCGMGYRTRVSLLIHMKAKHQGHLGCFECTPCDRLFISQEECEQHMASFHHV